MRLSTAHIRYFVFMVVVAYAGVLSAQTFPSKHIRIVAAAVGGGNDLAARIVAQKLSGAMGQPVIVENRGSIGSEIVSKATPDGYSLLFYSSSLWISPYLRDLPPFDARRDFTPIGLSALSPNILVVHPLLPLKTLNDLIALAKAQPGVLNYGSSSTGSAQHLAAELLKSMAGINIVRINYKGPGAAISDLLSGQVQIMISTAASVSPHVKSGRLRALAVGSPRPSALTPGLPTVAASGLPGYEAESPFGLFAPVKTPASVISRLNQEIAQVLQRAEVKERLFNSGIEPVGSSPEQLATAMKTDMTRMGKVITDAGIRAE